jgi:transcriptional regulator
MFIPKIYKNEDADAIKDFIKQNSFGILVSQTNQQLWATHIPIILTTNEIGEEVLQGHVSIANPQSKNFVEGSDVLAIFSGPHAYISSSWYDHENVPTWNYIAVHFYGKIKRLEGESLLKHLSDLTATYESKSEKPVSLAAMNPDFIKREMRGLVGFEITITEIQAAHKLSQNRNDRDHANIINELEKSENTTTLATAEAMRKNR